MHELENNYGLEFTNDWQEFTVGQMGELLNVAKAIRDTVGGIDNFLKAWGGTKIQRHNNNDNTCGSALCGGADSIDIYNQFYDGSAGNYPTFHDLAHEFGHVWDFRNKVQLSARMANDVGSTFSAQGCDVSSYLNSCTGFDWRPGPGTLPSGSYANASMVEDFAEAFALWVTFGEDPNYYGIKATTYTDQQFGRRIISIQRQWYNFANGH